MKVFILFHDSCEGRNEEWNLNYITPEVFFSEEKLHERIQWIKDRYGEEALEYCNYDFQHFELDGESSIDAPVNNYLSLISEYEDD